MISAKKAKKVASEHATKLYTGVKEVSDHIKLMSEVGFCNAIIDVPNKKLDKLKNKLDEKGFRTFKCDYITSNHKDASILEIEW